MKVDDRTRYNYTLTDSKIVEKVLVDENVANKINMNLSNRHDEVLEFLR